MNKKELALLQEEFNRKEQYEIDYGCWLYKLSAKKDYVILKVYDSELDENYLQFTYTVSKENDMYKLIKSIINKIYEEEINFKQSYVKSTPSAYKRKIKSLSL